MMHATILLRAHVLVFSLQWLRISMLTLRKKRTCIPMDTMVGVGYSGDTMVGVGYSGDTIVGVWVLECLRRIWLDWVSCSLFPIQNQSQPTKKYLLWEKVAQTPLSTYFFLVLGWPWAGEFVAFIMTFRCFPTQQNLVNRKHPILATQWLVLGILVTQWLVFGILATQWLTLGSS